jgi:hypothetical protein
MKQNVPPAVMVIAIIVAIAIIGFVGYRVMTPPTPPSAVGQTKEQLDEMVRKMSGGKMQHAPGTTDSTK